MFQVDYLFTNRVPSTYWSSDNLHKYCMYGVLVK